MRSFLGKVYRLFKGVFGGGFADKLAAGVKRAVPYVRKAYEVCKLIAELAPNRTLEEILEASEKLGVPALLDAPSGENMRYVAFKALKKAFPNAPDSAINLAIEIAVNALKGEKGVQGQ